VLESEETEEGEACNIEAFAVNPKDRALFSDVAHTKELV